MRLADDAFNKICNCVVDSSIDVRISSIVLLGMMINISPKFLHQTLDKKLMSNMRRKKTYHEMSWENVISGEWASGRKWGDDLPREFMQPDRVSVMHSQACGAFVHGLEDEYLGLFP